jgi:hypothetical protein
VVAVEAAREYSAAVRDRTKQPRDSAPDLFSDGPSSSTMMQLAPRHALFAAIVAVCLLPTFITRSIIYGDPFESGYIPLRQWAFRSPYFWSVLFSANHGLFVWTPVVLLSVIGLIIFRGWQPRVGTPLLAALLAFYVFIACYPDWAGISSYGNRFFVSLTALFIVGLSVLLDRIAPMFRTPRSALLPAYAMLCCLILWNLGFMFQWGTHLVPVRGPISWAEMIHNQFLVVPGQISTKVQNYLFHRANLMRKIEERDLEQMNRSPAP